MTAQTPIKSWTHDSHAHTCTTCNGSGVIGGYVGTYGTSLCKGPWEADCTDCDGTGIVPCAVCGSEIVANGFDCIVCDFAENLPTGVDFDCMVAAISGAIKAKEAATRECAA